MSRNVAILVARCKEKEETEFVCAMFTGGGRGESKQSTIVIVRAKYRVAQKLPVSHEKLKNLFTDDA